jgi:MHS family proline/betaine transporter-like MFS transporter
MIFVYGVTYLQQVVHISGTEALNINTTHMLVVLLLSPIAGGISDRIGRKPLLARIGVRPGSIHMAVVWMMSRQSFASILLGQLGFAVLIGVFLGVGAPAMVQVFRPNVRCSALAIGYNVCSTFFGGTTPVVCAYLVAHTHNNFVPAFYLMSAAIVALALIFSMDETAEIEGPRLVN